MLEQDVQGRGSEAIKRETAAGPSICIGCGREIFDRYILRVAPDLEWHAACLRCHECHQFLDETCTAFVKDGKTYCKNDYVRLFSVRCGRCGGPFAKSDCVMRARRAVYHIECFACAYCHRRLVPGDEFAIRPPGEQIVCRSDHEMLSAQAAAAVGASMGPAGFAPPKFGTPPPGSMQYDAADAKLRPVVACSLASGVCGPPVLGTVPPMGQTGAGTSTGTLTPNRSPVPPPLGAMNTPASVGPNGSVANSSHSSASSAGSMHNNNNRVYHKKDKKDKTKTTRVRTVLNESQLRMLRQCYNANPRPDALQKEQLVEMTGLSPRVIRVWFQNKRCKDKKRQEAMRLMQQQQEKNQALNGVRMSGVGPLVAGSPVPHHDLSAGGTTPLDIHQMHQAAGLWTPHSGPREAAGAPPMHSQADTTPFQHLMHTFGETENHATLSFGFDHTVVTCGGGGPGTVSGGMDAFSPQVAPSDMSSPSCSE